MRLPKTEKDKIALLLRLASKPVNRGTNVLCECCGTKPSVWAGNYIGFKYVEKDKDWPVSTRTESFLIPDEDGALLIEWDDK